MRRIPTLPLVLLLLTTVLVAPARASREPKLLSDGESRYPHAIRLSDGNIVASADHWGDGTGVADIYRSADGGTFRKVATITDPEADRGLCCAHLYELPRRVGKLPKGTLLWAGTTGHLRGRMTLRIWRSDNHGTTWRYLSTCATSPDGHGIWEPELSVDADGHLVCHYADETSPDHSQMLVRTTSPDGTTWSDRITTVALTPRGYRPGMPHVRRLPDGTYFMTYEICGQRGQYFCEPHFRTSPNGSDWGDPTNPGTSLHSRNGRYFAHTPTIELAPGGRIVLIGQMLMTPDGKIDEGNGSTLFISDNNTQGPWYEAPAPISVPKARDVNCPNYHPSLVTSPDGHEVLELTSDYDSTGKCQVRYATGPLP
ncbi:exo-alpha-sialidase [Umezawaea tangerina]|uniref:BNR repeat protein n=1 Tax=Umezawaea tangerina TaxID=84725 RepID=A0A2T0TAN6_9PSEU|nr:exo-alpha-sialidase [Umezawaea tangerina]PRY42732.1 hypothetical protein CLV43_104567 [Umezawaea tangerina]